MHKKYMEEIIKTGKKESIECLEYVFDKAMEHLAECDYEMYEKLEMKLYIVINGKQLDEDMAEKIILNMQPYHMKWTLAETTEAMKKYNVNVNAIDFWVVMNMAWNDFHSLFGEDLEKYIEYSRLFIEDEDAKQGKVFTYFTEISK